MKSTDEPIDEVLRKALKRKFDTFEKEPDPSLIQSIFHTLKVGQSPGIAQQFIQLSLLFAIIVTATLMFLSSWEEDPKNTLAGLVTPKTEKGTSLHKGIVKHDKSLDGELKGRKVYSDENRKDETLTREQPVEITQESVSLSEKLKSPTVAANKLLRKSEKGIVTKTERFKDDTESQSDVYDAQKLSVLPVFAGEKNRTDYRKEIGVEQETTFPTQASDVAGNDGQNKASPINNLELLDNRQPVFSSFPRKEMVVNTTPPVEAFPAVKERNQWRFLATAASMNTFQLLTIIPDPKIRYQNFRFPDRISVSSLGHKFNVGVEKNGFQFLLNYGQFKQSLIYEIATDEFLVEHDETSDYKLVRKGIPVEEKSTFRLLGLGVKKHVVAKDGPFKNYYLDLGTEVSRELSTSQNAVWGNFGIGKQITVSRKTSLVIGPYFEYSFVKLKNTENRFQIQPYQIGLSVGLRYLQKR